MTNTASVRFRIVSTAAINELLAVGCYCAGVTRLLAGEPELAVATQVDSLAGIELRGW